MKSTKKKDVVVRKKAWAICFKYNKKCMQGETPTFPTKKEAKIYNKELHQKIGGFEDDHHFVKCFITYTLNPKTK